MLLGRPDDGPAFFFSGRATLMRGRWGRGGGGVLTYHYSGSIWRSTKSFFTVLSTIVADCSSLPTSSHCTRVVCNFISTFWSRSWSLCSDYLWRKNGSNAYTQWHPQPRMELGRIVLCQAAKEDALADTGKVKFNLAFAATFKRKLRMFR